MQQLSNNLLILVHCASSYLGYR